MVSIYGPQAVARDSEILDSWRVRLAEGVSMNYGEQVKQFGLVDGHLAGLSVVEYGCGPSGGVLPIFTKAKRRIGVDVLMDDYERAGMLRRMPGVELVKGDMGDPKWTDEFNAAFCINALDHGANNGMPDKALWSIYQALRPCGKLYLHFHCRTRDQVNMKHLYSIDENWLYETADVIGFKIDQMDIFPTDPLNFVNERTYKTVIGVLGK